VTLATIVSTQSPQDHGLTYSDLSKTGSSGGVIFSTSGGDKLKLKNIDDLDESHFFMLGATVPGPSTPNGTSPKPTDYSNQVNGDSGDNRLNAIAAGSWLEAQAKTLPLVAVETISLNSARVLAFLECWTSWLARTKSRSQVD